MTVGDEVTLVADKGEVITRTIVSVHDGVYFVCKREEFEASKREAREPVCVGFKREYVLRDPVTAK
jgi:hypothetical protein